ncbi:MAG: SusD/RagB family nutrient-binding outer membrane lipoprotein [Bacteroidota bacterium]|nr:SusD/RagB family nutrient-binding outer membrane lipoprotein [Bacteroidota bacterium]
MKFKFFKYIYAAGVLSLLGLTGCQKKLDDAYKNPNAPVVVPVETLLPSLIGSIIGSSAAAGSAYGIAGDALLIGRYVQYWGTYSNTVAPVSLSISNASNYDVMGGTVGSSDNLGSLWAAFYFGHGANLNRMVQWAAADQKWDYVGVGRALRAWGWLELANEYADAIIVKEAFDASRQQFDYDPQSLAYDSCRAACYDAISYLSRTDGKVSQANLAIGDAYFYNGDVNKWKKFVYGILARSYAYVSNKSSYSADSVIKYCNLAMTSNADNATCKFAGGLLSGQNSYFGILRGNVGTIRQSQYIANLLTGNNSTAFTGVADPRAFYLLRENTNGTIKGIVPWSGLAGLSTADQPSNFWGGAYTATVSPSNENGCRYLFRNTAEFPIMTASEMQFLLAEAAYRKGDKATALTAYTNAISLNIDMLRNNYATNVPTANLITDANKAAYLSNTLVVPTSPSGLTLTQIMLQKYIALYGWGVQETWADMRRFHYTDMDPVTGKQVYADFTPPPTGTLFSNNNGKYVYRCRPRYNSEFLYDIPSLTKVGALDGGGSQVPDYHTQECWFSLK